MKKRRIAMGLVAAMAIGIVVWMGNKMHTTQRKDFHTKTLGTQVYLFSPKDETQKIQQVMDAVYAKQEANQFGKEHVAFLFLPGEYPDVEVKVGFYTQVMGLGALPTDTKIGHLSCDARWLGDDPGNHNALCNFWRSVENVEVMENTLWAVSQATDMRRVQIDGALYLHDNYGWASGGFLANSNIDSMVDSGSQQQWLSRNNRYRAWMGQNWNIVFAGDDPEGLPNGTWPMFSYTRAEGVAGLREKPYLAANERQELGLVIPAERETMEGCDWLVGKPTEQWIPLKDCYVATPDSSVEEMNAALAQEQHLLLTPGVYTLEESLQVTQPGTVILGLGLPSLIPQEGNACIETKASGVTIAGVLLDAGETKSETLLHMEATQEWEEASMLSDVYFRVGGRDTTEPTQAETCLQVDANHVIGDNLWIWRADHGDQVGWDKNTAAHGAVINGDDVTMVALMVEHFQEEQTVWNGNGGRLVMYQSEVPYDIPSGEALPSLLVGQDVSHYKATGLGVYLYNRDATIPMEMAISAPQAPGVSFEHIITVMLGNSHPGIHHVINDAGGSVTRVGETQQVLRYCNGDWK